MTFRALEDFSSICSWFIQSRHGFCDRDVSKRKRVLCTLLHSWQRWQQLKRVSQIVVGSQIRQPFFNRGYGDERLQTPQGSSGRRSRENLYHQ